MILLEEKVVRKEAKGRISKEGVGRHNPHEKFDLQCVCYGKNGHEAMACRVSWEKIKDKLEDKDKILDLAKDKALKSAGYIVSHCNIGVIEDLFNTSFTSWRDAWLLDTYATCHMTFQRDFFEDFNDNVDSIVYFVDKSSLKPLGIGTVMLKLLRFPTFLLHDVLYLPELQRNLLSLMHIQ
jgi:hypothetical protein